MCRRERDNNVDYKETAAQSLSGPRLAVSIRVILCTHNGVRFLEAQLSSIMDQACPVDAVHLLDFASSDGTRELLQKLAKRWPKLHVAEVDHAPGVTQSFFHAFAQVLPKCGDEDVIFLSDQDDIWLPDKVGTMVACLSERDVDREMYRLAFHDVIICDEALRPLRHSFYEGRPFRLPRDIDPSRLLIANPVIGHTIVVTKPFLDLALSCLRPDRYAMHDWALVLLAAYIGDIRWICEPLGLYRQHEANILGAGRRRSPLDYVTRAFRLSRSINIQTLAFDEDLRCAIRKAELVELPDFLPGIGPLPWRLGNLMVRRGPTIWHRLMALLQLKYVVRSPSPSSHNSDKLVA